MRCFIYTIYNVCNINNEDNVYNEDNIHNTDSIHNKDLVSNVENVSIVDNEDGIHKEDIYRHLTKYFLLSICTQLVSLTPSVVSSFLDRPSKKCPCSTTQINLVCPLMCVLALFAGSQ